MSGPNHNPNVPQLARLRTLRALARGVLVFNRGTWIIAAFVGLLVGAGLVDYVLRTPGWMRGVALAFGLLTIAGLLWRHLWPALKFNPALEDLALRVERTPAGQSAGLGGLLASGVGLAPSAGEPTLPGAMAAKVTDEAAKRFGLVSLLTMIEFKPALRAGAVCLTLLAIACALVVWRPRLSAIGAQRVLTPWTGVQWPKRTTLADATVLPAARVHPLGKALPIRAGLVRSPASPEDAQVEARYRVITGDRAGPVQVMVLNLQPEAVRVRTVDVEGREIDAEVPQFAQEVPSDALRPSARAQDAPPPTEIEYWLSSGDDQTQPRRIRLVAPPGITGAVATITPPAYLPAQPRTSDLGPGVDERATLAGVLSGSRVSLALTFSKPVPVPGGPDKPDLAALFGPAVPADAQLIADGDRWTVRFVAAEPARLNVRLVDEFGIESSEEAVFRVQTTLDNAAEATVTVPDAAIDVLPDATVPIAVEARDDLGLESLAAQWQLARRPIGSLGAVPTATDPPADLKREAIQPAAGAQLTTRATVTTTIIPRDLAAQPGDEILITALAADVFRDGAGQPRPPVRSSVRRIRVISADDLTEQIWNQLQNVRRSAIRTLEQQAAARERVERARSEPQRAEAEMEAAAREQAQVQQSLSRLREAVAQAKARTEQNGLTDQPLNEAIQAARRLADQAAQEAEEAQQRLAESRAASREAQDQSRPPAERQPARERAERAADRARQNQQQAERNLEDLARQLDKGQDTWAVRRALERLAAEQRALREQTERLSRETAGKGREDLSPQQREQAEQASQQQQDLAKKAEETIRQLQEAARQTQKNEPTTSAALQEAAQRAQRNQLQQQMERAAQQIRQNQQQQAQEQQQRAEQTIQQMLQDVNRAAQQRDAVLRRQLESLMETIRGLIRRQQVAINDLDARNGNLDTQLMTLSAATLAAAEQARAAGQETVAVARHLSAAADLQDEGLGHLREEPANFALSRKAQESALGKLNDALSEAQKAMNRSQNREDANKRRELREVYRALIAEQKLITASTRELVGKPVDRRLRFVAADLAARQTAVRTRAAEMLKTFPDLTRSPTFPIAHNRVDSAAAAAAERIAQAQITAGVTVRQESIVRTLEGLLAALKEPEDNDPFRSPESGGDQQGGGGGQQQPEGLIPSAAELELLKALQTEALTVTRQAADAQDAELARLSREDAAKLQAELPKLAEEIVKRLESGGQPEPDTPGNDKKEGGNPPS